MEKRESDITARCFFNSEQNSFQDGSPTSMPPYHHHHHHHHHGPILDTCTHILSRRAGAQSGPRSESRVGGTWTTWIYEDRVLIL